MRSLFQFIFIVVVVAAEFATAADAQPRMSPPSAGYIFDPEARSIRSILGSPGASVIGPPLDLGIPVASSVISPRQDFAILVGAENADVRVLQLQPDNFRIQVLPQSAPAPRLVTMSPSGRAVGLYYSESPAKLQVFAHLSQAPLLAHEINLDSLTGDLLAAAISDDGEAVLFLTGDRENSSTWLSYAGTNPIRLQSIPSISVMAFQSDGYDVAMATRDGQVFSLRNLVTSPDLQTLWSQNDRTSDPVAVRFSREGTRVYLVTRQGMTASLGVETEGATFVDCGCHPSGLFSLNSGTMIRLNEISDGPLKLLDIANPEPRIWFVPALLPEAGAAGGAQ